MHFLFDLLLNNVMCEWMRLESVVDCFNDEWKFNDRRLFLIRLVKFLVDLSLETR